MGLLQWAYETYEHNVHLAGMAVEGKREPLTPISHLIQNAHIEVTLRADGTFLDAIPVPKADCRTIIPVTEDSASRAGMFLPPHPLCDQLPYLCAWDLDKHAQYLAQLSSWANSPDTHSKVQAILSYISKGTILNDLERAKLLTLAENGLPTPGKIEGTALEKCLVRWRIFSDDDSPSACWEDPQLFECFQRWYMKNSSAKQDLCLLTGEYVPIGTKHPKGMISTSSGAKLISSNDSSGFTYRGHFSNAEEAGSIGYIASQKAHSALRWIAANDGVTLGGRTFLTWNPAGAEIPSPGFLGFAPSAVSDPVSYHRALRDDLTGWQQNLSNVAEDTVVIAALDAATTGRLSVTYCSVLKGSDFLARLNRWYESCAWFFGFGDTSQIRSPSIKHIINCAFGREQQGYIQADTQLLREHSQRLLRCVVDGQPIPIDILRALVNRASTPLAYKKENRAYLLSTTCAVIRKYHNDVAQREELTMDLDHNIDRSFLYGRLLAIFEHVERSTYSSDENREPNAIRMQAVFCQRPLYARGILEKRLIPYFQRLSPGLRKYFKDLIGTITVDLYDHYNTTELSAPLTELYLMGYYVQRNSMFRSRTNNKEESEV